MQFTLEDKIVDVVTERKNNKNLYIRAMDSHTLLVTCNYLISKKEILKILEKNQKSLLKMLNQKEKEETKGQFFWYLGKSYNKVFDETQKKVTLEGNNVFSKDEKMLEKFYKKECLRVFQSEVERIVEYFPNIPDFTLRIRYMKTRWGVNNRSNHTITLNSELLKKDLDLLDYVIIHELCHFYEANHSSRFWRYVEEYYPHYKEARKRLRE